MYVLIAMYDNIPSTGLQTFLRKSCGKCWNSIDGFYVQLRLRPQVLWEVICLAAACGIQSSRKVASSAGLNQLPLRLPSLCMLCLAGVGDSLYAASLLIFNSVMRSSLNSHELRRY
uniref:Uncharacterized protein n=1 Tax=Triticum urartu TaxID=4572 RepID=A0A8R7JV57_TRIUA